MSVKQCGFLPVLGKIEFTPASRLEDVPRGISDEVRVMNDVPRNCAPDSRDIH
jgi:hypothetical protein